MDLRRLALVAVIAFLGAIAGVFVGRAWFGAVPHHESELHSLLHERLELDAGQRARLDEIERRFAVRRKALEFELRADNARLADAIEAEHGNGPQVRAAVDKSHQAMGELQKETLAHLFAMRQILRPDQAAKFDRVVVRALTAEHR